MDPTNNNDDNKTRNDKEIELNEQGILIREDGHLWGGDLFSSDLDSEEIEWSQEAFGTTVDDNDDDRYDGREIT